MGIVFLLAILCELFMVIYVSMEIKEKYLPAVIYKGIASLFFVVIGLVGSSGGRTDNLVILGLVLGFIADILLNLQYLLDKNGKLVFAIGAIVFLAGHIAYFAAIYPLVSNHALFLLLGLAVAVVLEIILFKLTTVDKVMLIFGIIYVTFVTLLTSISFGALVERMTNFSILFFSGIFLFLASDVVLIVNYFGQRVRNSLRFLNGVLYYTGQILVAISLIWLQG
ncbi:lysoplasmalogenase family protein [Butyrivibrio sp. YAB3001]|uniref:lysoplasmalogenase family protein n=1 Tax=Butyrivibrio sp. YAB3001 TaxID=1520812 RepID=UPI0008F636A6|nr:lysoplasmalogenase family protein [Butyrivibrio sp. YAB3001]SFD08556.1 Uncharacterized membrane protein YhhN [Butyrivibrio sp. YAB3001]